MIERLPDELILALRAKFFSGSSGELARHLGLFVQWFGIAEMQITHALAIVLGFSDLDRLQYLIRGMDARVKCQRFRQSTKEYWPLGPYLSGELTTFENDCIPTRNKLSHCWPTLNAKTRIVHYATLGKMPDTEDEKPPSSLSKNDGIHLDDLMSQAMWLNGLSSDFLSAIEDAKRGQPLETDESRRRQPRADH